MKKDFDITGMTCAACAAHVEKAVKKAGAANASVNLLRNRLTVDTDLSDETIIKAVEGAGYGATVVGGAAVKSEKTVDYSHTLLVRFIASLVFLLPLMYFSMGHMAHFPMGAFDPHVNPASFALIQLVLTTPILMINYKFFVGGAKSVIHRSASMDTLVSLGAGASYIYGLVVLFVINGKMAAGDVAGAVELGTNLFFESAAMILTLVTLGKFLEAKSKGKTRSEVEKLMRLRPQTATVLRDGQEIEIAVDEIAVGDAVVVLPGQYVPCDGVITDGATTFDKSAITGESIPVEALVGDKATSATVNLTGRIIMRAEKVGADTTLSEIIELIENAGGSKAPVQRIADKVSAVFVPIVCGIALAVFIIWLALGFGIGHALTMGISVLVISCPCALGLATPVAVMAGTGRAAAYGVLVKNAETLQSVGGTKIFALDKTATITEGKPRVTDISASGDHDKDLILKIAAALESTSTHPLAHAVTSAYDGEITPPEKSEYRVGLGVVGTVDGETYALGSAALAREFGVTVEETDAQTMYLCKRGEMLGTITVDDAIKPTSKKAIELLKSTGARVVMLTGDNERQAKRIAEAVGIDEVYCNVMPEDKLEIVEELKKQGRTAMVGDGINDAPALKAADVGIAIGSGTDVAIEAADIVLVKSDLTDVARSVAVSVKTLGNVKQNLFWAFIYNTLGIPLAAGALYPLGVTLNPMIAAGAMACSSLFVVCNALRLNVMRFDDEHLPRKLKKIGKKSNDPNISTDIRQIKKQGEQKMQITLNVSGMSCHHCSARVKSALEAVKGVQSAEVDLENGTATVVGNFSADDAVKAVVAAGYEASVKN